MNVVEKATVQIRDFKIQDINQGFQDLGSSHTDGEELGISFALSYISLGSVDQ